MSLWSSISYTDAANKHEFVVVTPSIRQDRVNILDAPKIWQQNPNILFSTGFRIAGTREDIIRALLNSDATIDQVGAKGVVDNSLSRDNINREMRSIYDQEVREYNDWRRSAIASNIKSPGLRMSDITRQPATKKLSPVRGTSLLTTGRPSPPKISTGASLLTQRKEITKPTSVSSESEESPESLLAELSSMIPSESSSEEEEELFYSEESEEEEKVPRSIKKPTALSGLSSRVGTPSTQSVQVGRSPITEQVPLGTKTPSLLNKPVTSIRPTLSGQPVTGARSLVTAKSPGTQPLPIKQSLITPKSPGTQPLPIKQSLITPKSLSIQPVVGTTSAVSLNKQPQVSSKLITRQGPISVTQEEQVVETPQEPVRPQSPLTRAAASPSTQITTIPLKPKSPSTQITTIPLKQGEKSGVPQIIPPSSLSKESVIQPIVKSPPRQEPQKLTGTPVPLGLVPTGTSIKLIPPKLSEPGPQ